MKRYLAGILVSLLVLSGCGNAVDLETVNDVYIQPEEQPQQVLLELPQLTYVPVLQSEGQDRLYLCDGYTVCIQTLAGGDLDRTLRTVTGYGSQNLQLQKMQNGEHTRYLCVYSAAGEGQTQIGRTCILDDGSFHYALTVLASEARAGALKEQIQSVFNSFDLTPEPINTGS